MEDAVHSIVKPTELGRLHKAESSISSGSQEILRILLNPKVRYRVHNSPLPVCILRPVQSFPHPFMHSFCCLSCGRSTAFPKRVVHRVQSSAASFNFQCRLFSLRSFSSCVVFFLSRRLYPSLCLSFSNVFQKAVPTQDVTNPVTVPFYCVQDVSLLDSS